MTWPVGDLALYCAWLIPDYSHEQAELAESVHSDFASREFHLVNRAPMSVWLGDLCSTESRLAIQVGHSGILGVVAYLTPRKRSTSPGLVLFIVLFSILDVPPLSPLQALNIKGICTIASHGIDELWKDDGVAYHTAIVSNSAPIALHLDACVEFIRR